MLLLESRLPTFNDRLWAICGVGLIGEAIARRLDALIDGNAQLIAVDWNSTEQEAADWSEIGSKLLSRLDSSKRRLDVLWSAGRAGFGSSIAQTEKEKESFHRCLETVESVRHRTSATVHFHAISSIGGLYEGQRAIDETSEIRSKRPYGGLKWQQERLLLESELESKSLYRISSVYGPIAAGKRMGLIATMIRNGIRQQVTKIEGHFSTLRDFVWLQDVANYIGDRLTKNHGESRSEILFLGSGKPTTIGEIKLLVESALRRRLYIHCESQPSNADDISVSPKLLPKDWIASDLGTNIRSICHDSLMRGIEMG